MLDRIDCLKDQDNLNKINISLHCEHNKNYYFDEVFNTRDKYLKDKTVIYRLWTLQDKKLDKISTGIVERIIKHYKLNNDVVEKLYEENNVKIDSNLYVDKDNEFKWPSLSSSEESEGFCFSLKTQVAILVDGTVVPCCLDSNGDVFLGNIYKESFKSIIEGYKFTKLKKSFEDRKPSSELCRKCSFKNKFN